MSVAKKNVWIVVPGKNEEKYIAVVLKKITRITSNIIVVDDGSTDNFASISRRFTPHVLSHVVNLGKGSALKTGCEYAFNELKADAVVFMDSDDQHDPAELPLFFNALNAGHQVIFGVRSFNEHMPEVRKIVNKIASILIFILFGAYIPDIPSGYKALTAKAYEQLVWQSSDYSVEMEIAARTAKKRLDFVTVPIKTIYHDLDRGMTFLDSVKMVTQILSWRISL